MDTGSAQSRSIRTGRSVLSIGKATRSRHATSLASRALSHVKEPLHAVKIIAPVSSLSTIPAPAYRLASMNTPSVLSFAQPSGGRVQRSSSPPDVVRRWLDSGLAAMPMMSINIFPLSILPLGYFRVHNNELVYTQTGTFGMLLNN